MHVVAWFRSSDPTSLVCKSQLRYLNVILKLLELLPPFWSLPSGHIYLALYCEVNDVILPDVKKVTALFLGFCLTVM